jgi:hypothetical protein
MEFTAKVLENNEFAELASARDGARVRAAAPALDDLGLRHVRRPDEARSLPAVSTSAACSSRCKRPAE